METAVLLQFKVMNRLQNTWKKMKAWTKMYWKKPNIIYGSTYQGRKIRGKKQKDQGTFENF